MKGYVVRPATDQDRRLYAALGKMNPGFADSPLAMDLCSALMELQEHKTLVAKYQERLDEIARLTARRIAP